MPDEIAFKRTIANIKVLIESVEITEVKHALTAMLHLLIMLDERIDELGGDEDE
jgi:hypothetical protein